MGGSFTGGRIRSETGFYILASRTDPQKLIDPTMTGSIPMSGQAKGKPAAIVTTTTQTPKAIIPAEIKNESTVSMIGDRKIESEKPVY